MNIRVGKGFDIHRMAKGLPFLLGGIPIEYDKGCVAHSDGDVLIHAVIDALLGASGRGDIGTLFPDTDPHCKNAPGESLLKETLSFLPSITIINIDTTVFCEKPKIEPYRERIISSLASLLSVESCRINLKAKTMEQTGAIGSGDAVAADAVVLLELKGD